MAQPVEAATRKRVLRVVFVSLLLDLISFTFILPLFPKLLEFYRNAEAPLDASAPASKTLLSSVLGYLNTYKAAFARPIDSRYDIVLLGGALGSLFSLLQAIASPIIGHLSDRHGRRTALLASMAGNILSVLLWVVAVDFRTFLASRVVGGLSEGNVQLATAIATDISDANSRGSTMALIGACFSIAFTFGPALGAYLSSIATVAANPFATAAGVSLFLILTETVYLYYALPETLPRIVAENKENSAATTADKETDTKTAPAPALVQRTNSHFLLNFVHMTFLLFFSGMEFSLPFMTYDLFAYTSAKNGRLLGYVGLVASLLQGGVTRRLPPLLSVRIGVVACLISFGLLARISTVSGLYLAATGLATTSATVVSGLNTLSSFEASEGERGGKLGILRSWGQLGRGLGPVLFTSVYWWAGREVAYAIGATGIAFVSLLVLFGLKNPPGSVQVRGAAKKKSEKQEL
ncbi:major facilitator superfamily domain-containing protein [Podospora australis]|uniref:Major facilitator superfamily domain-containing protein n=1 Tax=Podospora australis TaxID=1536484 RepID=A0AAN6WVN8_9PEZI|nr:major facilitator superfamily domain-containing protein [Podospora australis]